MPFITSGSRRNGRLLGGLVGLALMVAAPAAQASTDVTSAPTAANPVHCVPDPALTKPFVSFGDDAYYTLAPGGDFEGRRAGWSLTGGARVVEGNEPWQVGGADDESSLLLPSRSRAVSAPICIDETYPTFRFFARNTGDRESTLTVEVLYVTTAGDLGVRASGELTATSSDWTLADPMEIGLAIDPESPTGAAPVAFRFTPQGSGGRWQIDDVYVDPMARG